MKKAISLILTIVMCVSLCACVSSDKLCGTYVGTWKNNKGAEVRNVVVLYPDATYEEVTYIDGEIYDDSTGVGDFEIQGRKVKLYPSDSIVYHGRSRTYTYRGGALVNNGNKLIKIS